VTARLLEQHLFREPYTPLRLTLANGEQVLLRHPNRFILTRDYLGCAMGGDPKSRVCHRVKFVYLPSIAIVEPIKPRRGNGGRR
jgi:hypothetical protein